MAVHDRTDSTASCARFSGDPPPHAASANASSGAQIQAAPRPGRAAGGVAAGELRSCRTRMVACICCAGEGGRRPGKEADRRRCAVLLEARTQRTYRASNRGVYGASTCTAGPAVIPLPCGAAAVTVQAHRPHARRPPAAPPQGPWGRAASPPTIGVPVAEPALSGVPRARRGHPGLRVQRPRHDSRGSVRCCTRWPCGADARVPGRPLAVRRRARRDRSRRGLTDGRMPGAGRSSAIPVSAVRSR